MKFKNELFTDLSTGIEHHMPNPLFIVLQVRNFCLKTLYNLSNS